MLLYKLLLWLWVLEIENVKNVIKYKADFVSTNCTYINRLYIQV